MRRHALSLSILAPALAVAVLAAACGDDNGEEPAPAPSATTAPTQASAPDEVQLTQTDDGATVQLADGGTLIVALPSNPSTGYSWSVSEQSSPLLVLQGEPAFVPAAQRRPSSALAARRCLRTRPPVRARRL